MEGTTYSSFRIGAVIPAIENRIENTKLVADRVLNHQTLPVQNLVIVCDGFVGSHEMFEVDAKRTIIASIQKHEPGKEQPRNVGVRYLNAISDCNYVWFIDSDVYPADDCVEHYSNAHHIAPAYDKVMIGPYDWMNPGRRFPDPHLRNDPRWDMFDENDARTVFTGHLGVALGCFSGNLVWPIKEFQRVGGFWNELHMGRCEDGELGIRAAAMQVPMILVKKARGWHMHHEIDLPVIHEKNKRDVPMINERHPYVEGEGLVVVDYDGKRFNQICENCGESINTLEYWSHASQCHPSE